LGWTDLVFCDAASADLWGFVVWVFSDASITAFSAFFAFAFCEQRVVVGKKGFLFHYHLFITPNAVIEPDQFQKQQLPSATCQILDISHAQILD
jgi:hypothetical protein